MRLKTILLSLCLAANTLSAQEVKYKPRVAPMIFSFVGGAFDGVGEATQHHWDKFQAKFPGANPYYWNPDISWMSKYKNNDPSRGEAFPLSTSYLVSLTDFYHLRRSVTRVCAFNAGLFITLGEKRPLKHYLYDVGLSIVAHQVGFYIPYNLIVK